MLFFGQLTATWTEETEEEHGGWFYSCGHFRRDEERLGVCGIHETRPKMCSEFPYDKPITEWDDCSWNIELVDFDVVQGVLLWN
jgi:Fe-S-cluster containining protein